MTRLQMNRETYFKQFGVRTPYIYIDNGADVLAVGHLDTVWDHGMGGDYTNSGKSQREIAKMLKYDKEFGIIHSPALDDRLGVWVILDVLPEMGLEYDILLCDDEEIGRSTAKDALAAGVFAGKKYNWMFEWDRGGVDVPMYQYTNDDSEDLLVSYGFESGWGSFTDICDLDELGCVGFNFGTAYYRAHNSDHWANLNELWEQIQKFVVMFREQKDTPMPYDPKAKSGSNGRYDDRWGWYDDWDWYGRTASSSNRSYSKCDICNADADVWIDDEQLCQACYNKYEGGLDDEDDLLYPTDIDEGDEVPLLSARTLDKLRRLSSESPFKGLAYCDECGKEMWDTDLIEYRTNSSRQPIYLCSECAKAYQEDGRIGRCRTCGREFVIVDETHQNQEQCYDCYANSQSKSYGGL